MAKRKDNRPARRQGPSPEESSAQEFSLEDILSEYRLSALEPEPPREDAPRAEPIALEPEGEGVYTGRVAEPAAEAAPSAPEEEDWEPPEDEAPAPLPAAFSPDADVMDEMYAPEEIKPWVDPEADAHPHFRFRAPAPEETPRENAAPEESTEAAVTDEGFADDADFYAGAVKEKPADGGEGDAFADTPDASGASDTHSTRQKAGESSALGKIWEKLTGALAAASYRREQRRRQAPPEPENNDKEMPPEKAARYYASQMPALKLRSYGALGVCVLLSYITLGSGLGVGLPGSMATDARLASMVLLVGQISVLLLALDVVTTGVMSLARSRPGAESLLVVASLASVADTVAVILTKNAERGIPFGAVTSLGLFFALRGGWHYAKGCHDTFLALFQSGEPCTIAQERLPESEDKVLVSSRRETKGFVRRSEEPGEAELLASASFYPLLIAAAALSLAIAVGSGDMGAFFHVFALMTALCAGAGWLFSYPFLFSRTANSLMVRGCALSGWSGARDMGASRRLVIRDTDVFPEDTVEITGIRLLDKSKAQHIIACTGTMLSTAGTGTARVFTELMQRHKAAMQTVEEFSVGEGGCKGTIQYQEVRVGSLGYMYLSGVKVPDKLKAKNAVYTAIGGELSGVFLFRYRPVGSVRRSLSTLRRQRRKPLFIARDFNIDPHMIMESFGVSTEGFVFPPFPERYELAGALSESKNPVSGVMAREGLDMMVELSERGAQLYLFGRICAWAALIGGALGMALMLAPCWLGDWAAASALRALLYTLLWLLPALISRLLMRK